MWGGVGGGGGGGFHSIMWSPQLRFVLELGCDNFAICLVGGPTSIKDAGCPTKQLADWLVWIFL